MKFLKQYDLIFLTLLWTCIIFSFSLQTATESSQLSGGIVTWILEEVLPSAGLDFEFIEFPIRKMAHFAEFGLLGVLTMLSVLQIKLQWKWSVAIAYCMIVATTDETIQLFVPGRSGQISDVVLDSVGALCGIALMNVVWKRIKIIRSEKGK